MSTGFNVETYQLNKQENGGAGSGTTYDILARLETLENNQMNVFNQFFCNFKEDKYTDTYITNVQFVSNGIIARQYQSRWHDNLAYDDCVDWDKSKFIAHTNQSIKLDTPSTAYGEFYTLPITLAADYVGFKFTADTTIPIVETLIGRQMLKQGHLWFAQGIDNYGRIWLFRADTYKYENSQVFLTIYNPDMTIYKESIIAGIDFFGPVTNTSPWGYSAVHNSACVRFSEENLCIVAFMMINATKDGIYYDTAPSDGNGNNNSNAKNIVTFVDENGASQVRYNYLQGINQNYHHFYSSNVYHAYQLPFDPVRMIIHKNKIILITGPTSRVFGHQSYNTNRLGRVIISPTNGRLNSVSTNLIIADGYSTYYDNNDTHINNWATRYTTDFFTIGDVCYSIITDFNRYDLALGLADMWLAELDINDSYNVSAFTVDKAYKLQGTLAYPPYSFGGVNGMYYSKRFNYLYFFSNSTSSPDLYITRFEIDWTSKNGATNTINLINPLVKKITLPNTTYNGNFNQYYPQKLKVYEDDKLLNLVYGTNNAISTKREINYFSVDFDLNVVQPPAQVHISDGTAVDEVTSFDMIMNGKKTIIYGRGNRDDFNDPTAMVDSAIYTNSIQQVASSIDFFYSTDKDVTWKAINSGDTVTLPGPANKVNLRAILKSSAVFDSSPAINSLSVESWDNNHVASRQSVYASNQLDVLQNEGKAVLTADQELRDGTIDWYISFNGGLSWIPTALDTEFVYNYSSTPDFRVQAILSVQDNALNPPIVHNYTIKTSHMVLHSDLEEIQINLIKTNFKIDTYTKASKNGLLKMTIDTFSNDNAIDVPKSDYNYYATSGTVGGNYIITKPEVINDTVLTLLLTTDEVIDNTKSNSHIEYEVSIDGGITYKQINPNIKLQLNNTSSTTSTLVLKAIFYDNAQLNAWGWAWD